MLLVEELSGLLSLLSTLAAEMFHFQRERVVDYKEMMKRFLNEQITFYQEVRSRD